LALLGVLRASAARQAPGAAAAAVPRRTQRSLSQILGRVGKFPEVDTKEPQFSVSFSDNDAIARDANEGNPGPPTRVLRSQCRSANKQVCSGHGNCTGSGADVFGVGLTNTRSHVCRCEPEWYGSACHLSLQDLTARKAQRDALMTLLSAAAAEHVKAGKRLEHDLDDGSVFGRRDASHKQAHPYTPTGGTIRDEFEPSTTVLEGWVEPDEADLMRGARVLAKFERARLSIQMAPETPDPRKKFLRRSTMAMYTSEEGESILAPLIYPGQEGMPVADSANPLAKPDGAKADPTELKFLDALNNLFANGTKSLKPNNAP